jgi:hypothetical protein
MGSFRIVFRHFFACALMLSILGLTGKDIIVMDIKDMPLDKDKYQ